jgi:creatinine amidohydrolase
MSDQKEESDALSRRVFLGCAAVGGMAAVGGTALAAEEKLAPHASSLQWANITAERMPKVIKEVQGVCLVPWGCLERHGPHLPLGTDAIVADALCVKAAQIEPAVIFPAVFYAQIAEARHCSGTLSLDHELVLELMRATLDEIGRNGFTKIVVVNGHGGNDALLGYVLDSLLQQRKPYVAYVVRKAAEEDIKRWMEAYHGGFGHAGDHETSCLMYLRPETVHLEDLKDPSDGEARGRLKRLGNVRNSLSWYANYPTHFQGDPRQASAEKGAFWLDAVARNIARQIKTIKEDDVSARLAAEFYEAAERGGLTKKSSQ